MSVMTTHTLAGVGFEVLAIPPETLRDLRGRDDARQPPRLLLAAEKGNALRCCLQPTRLGEPVALVSYAPLRRWARDTGADPGPYDELGPVFIHPQECPGPDGTGYPSWMARSPRVLRAYGADGRIRFGRLVAGNQAGSPVPVETALAEILADPAVAVVHGRALEFGCFTFEARRCRD
jgi:hypothetical protein